MDDVSWKLSIYPSKDNTDEATFILMTFSFE